MHVFAAGTSVVDGLALMVLLPGSGGAVARVGARARADRQEAAHAPR